MQLTSQPQDVVIKFLHTPLELALNAALSTLPLTLTRTSDGNLWRTRNVVIIFSQRDRSLTKRYLKQSQRLRYAFLTTETTHSLFPSPFHSLLVITSCSERSILCVGGGFHYQAGASLLMSLTSSSKKHSSGPWLHLFYTLTGFLSVRHSTPATHSLGMSLCGLLKSGCPEEPTIRRKLIISELPHGKAGGTFDGNQGSNISGGRPGHCCSHSFYNLPHQDEWPWGTGLIFDNQGFQFSILVETGGSRLMGTFYFHIKIQNIPFNAP